MSAMMKRVCLALPLLALGACVVGPDHVAPDPVLPAAYSAPASPLPVSGGLWWQGFEDAALDGLIGEALSGNIDLAVARERLVEANALVEAEAAGLRPSVGAELDASGTSVISGSGNAGTGASAGLVFGFVPDLFGGQRRRIERAEAQRDAVAFDETDIRRTTVATIAERYIDWQRSRARLELLDTSLALQQQTLDIVERRAEAGLSADLDVQRAAADLATTRAQKGNLDIALASARHDLAILTGQAPTGFAALDDVPVLLPDFRGGPASGVPADLVRQRADLRAAERDLAAASAGIGVAEADLYPALSIPGRLTGDIGAADRIVDDVVDQLGIALSLSLTDGGERRANVRAAEARARQAALVYQGVLLDALGEVETALVTIDAIEAQSIELQTAVTASEQAFDQLNALYREGLASFIDILDAQRTLISSRQSQLESRANHAKAIIGLYRALGAPVTPAPDPASPT
ncbi:efflux transporter outer membrane subunit [Maricaulis alexandrii]|uniref:efflux transporter outer membrane subunit n=1 Tax=Maricaulis alexandrii TaxID=2570354 RepID=UPI0011089D1B|nr:efflux transporter outer membrane subunit [Maricaulis alexandrii]